MPRRSTRARYRVACVALALIACGAVASANESCPPVRRKSKIGEVSECSSSSRAARRLCGATAAAYDADRSVIYVAAPAANGVAVVDARKVNETRVASARSDPSGLRRPLDVRLHRSGTYVAILVGGDSTKDKLSSVVVANVTGVRASGTEAPSVVTRGTNCSATALLDGRMVYRGHLCGATAFDVDGDVAYVVVGDTNRLTTVSLPIDVASATANPPAVLGSIQSEYLANANAVTVRRSGSNVTAYVRSDGVCASCVAVVNVTDASAPVLIGESDVSSATVTADVDASYWTTTFLARGAHRENSTFEYDWVVDPVASSVTTVSRECVKFTLAIGDSPSACAGRNEFAYLPDAETEASAPFQLGCPL